MSRRPLPPAVNRVIFGMAVSGLLWWVMARNAWLAANSTATRTRSGSKTLGRPTASAARPGYAD